MRDLIVFEIDKNLYGLNLEYIQRIIQVPDITIIPDGHKTVDGMMSYEKKVIKVVNFRKLISMPSFSEKLNSLFGKLKQDHKEWIDALTNSVVDNTPFDKTMDPHVCDLGRWLDSFSTYEDEVRSIFKRLYNEHGKLHHSAKEVLELRKGDETAALTLLQTQIMANYEKTMSYLDQFVKQFETIADSMQKLLIYQDGRQLFGIKVDAIADIASIDDEHIRPMDDINIDSPLLDIEGVMEIDGKLVNIIKSVQLPMNEVA